MTGIDNCREKYPHKQAGCLREDVIYDAVETPVFAVEEQYDVCGIFGFRGDSGQEQEGLKYAMEYAKVAQKEIETKNPENGFFMSSCFGHCFSASMGMAEMSANGQTLE